MSNEHHDQSTQTHETGRPTSWEAAVLTHIATASLEEQKRARRWRIFIALAGLTLLWFLFTVKPGAISPSDSRPFVELNEEHVAVVRLDGVIFDLPENQPSGFDNFVNHDDVLEALNNAADNENCKGVILSINSPGGGVHATARLYNAIKSFRAEHPELPVVTHARSMALSGGYYVGMSGDRVYANNASLVGSIGVLIPGFGLDRSLEKIGAERRLIVSGPNKAIGDPFSPMSSEHRARFQALVDTMFDLFVNTVRDSRGDRLKGDEAELFSGAFWAGVDAFELGLIDGLHTKQEVAELEFEIDRLEDYTIRAKPWEKFFNQSSPSLNLLVKVGQWLGWQNQMTHLDVKRPLQPYYLAH